MAVTGAFNTPPLKRNGQIGRRLVLTFVAFVLILIGGSGWFAYRLIRVSLERQMSERLVAVALLVTEGLDQVHRLEPGYEGGSLHRALTARIRRARDMVGARRVYVFDRRGFSLLDSEPGVPIGREYVRLRVDRAELASAWAGRPAHSVLFQDEDGVYYKSGYAPVFSGGDVVAVVGVDIGAAFLETIEDFGRSMLSLGVVSMLVTVGIGLGLARTLTGPIGRLVAAARTIGRGNLEAVVSVPSRDELGYLAETMEEMRRKILARDEQLRQMLAGVAHEIRNPLGGIELYAGLIVADLADGDPRKAHIQKVIGEVRTLNRVITEFMDFARPSLAELVDVDVAHQLEEAIFLLAPEMEQAGVSCSRNISNGLFVKGDADQVKRALVNLMKNAIQAMPDGGELTVSASRQGERVLLEIGDTGVGMDEDVRFRLFEPFFTTREKGSGLGLAIVHKTIETHGGEVQVESASGKGTVFRVMLPAC